MVLTFDPSGLKSGYECVEFLKQKNITISQKMGARLLVLNSRKIQLSPAILEDCSPGSPLEALFLSPALTDGQRSGDPAVISELAAPYGVAESLRCLREEGTLKIVSPLEIDETTEEAGPGLPVLAQKPSDFLSLTSISPHSILSDRRYLEEMTLNFLDSEDPRIIIESLRKLTRIVLMSSRDPGGLFRMAFSRDDHRIWSACASIIKEMINNDLGQHLESFLKEDESEKRKGAFRIVLNDAMAHPDSFISESVLQILIKSLHKKDSFPLFSNNQKELLRLVKSYPIHLEEFIKNIFLRYYEYSPEELCGLRDFLHRVAGEYPGLTAILLQEVKKNNPPQYKIIILWILSPLSLSGAEEECIISLLRDLLRENIKDLNLLSMMKTSLIRLSPRSLTRLSSQDYYTGIDTELRLFILELWEHYFSLSKDAAIDNDDFCEALLMELNGIDIAMQRNILRLRTIQNPAVLRKLKGRMYNTASLIEAAAFTFVSHQNVEETSCLFMILQELIPDSPRLCFDLLQKKYYREEEFEDYIPFLAHLISLSPPGPDRGSTFLDEVAHFLNTLSRDKKLHGLVAIEALGVIYGRVPWKKSKVSMFVKRIIGSESLPFDIRIKTLSTLFLSQNLTVKTMTMVEDFFLEKLRTKKMRSPDLSFLLEQMNLILNSGKTFLKTGEFVAIFGKEIAFKLTQPTITEMMRSEASTAGPSKFMSQYETNPWKWEDVTEALFILLKMFLDKKAETARSHRILHIISYLVHHWSLSAAKKDELSRFFMPDIVLFRILRDLMQSVSREQAGMVMRIVSSVLSLLGKGRESLAMNEDLQHFLIAACALLKDESEEPGADFPMDTQREIITCLLRSSQGGSQSAKKLLGESLGENWLRDDTRRMISQYLQRG